MKPLIILAHGDFTLVFVVIGALGVALISGVTSIVAASLQKRGGSSSLALAAGSVAILVGGGVMVLLGWPHGFVDPIEVLVLFPIPLGVVGIALRHFRRQKKPDHSP